MGAMRVTIQLRRGTATEWAEANPVLLGGEPGWDTTNLILKMGNGIDEWADLDPVTLTPEQVAQVIELLENVTELDDGRMTNVLETESSDFTLALAGALGTTDNPIGSELAASIDGVVDPVKQFPALLAAGRKWAFMGDSFTVGTGAAAGRRYVSIMPSLVGTANMAPASPLTPAAGAVYSYDGGVAGERSDQILARVPTAIAAGVKGMTLLAGVNDAEQSVSAATFMTNVRAIAALCRAAGVPLVVGLVPPRASAVSAAKRTLIAVYNLALREWAPRAGVYLADTHTPLAVATDDTLSATYDSGDGIHVNTAGHRLIATAFATAAARAVVPSSGIVLAKTPLSLGRNPLFQADSAGPGLPTNWAEQPGGTGTAPTYTRVVDTTGKLPAGAQWEQIEVNNTSGASGQRHHTTSLNAAATWAVGDKLLIAYRMEIEDVAGFTAAADANPATAQVLVRIINGSTGTAIDSGAGQPVLSASPGPAAIVFEVPSGVTSLVLWVTVVTANGVHVKVRISAIDVINLTTAGLVGTY